MQTQHDPSGASAPLERPKLALWMFVRGHRAADLAKVLGKSRQAVGFYLLPFGDPNRRIPPEPDIALILQWTAGVVTAADHYPPHLNGQAAQPEPVQ